MDGLVLLLLEVYQFVLPYVVLQILMSLELKLAQTMMPLLETDVMLVARSKLAGFVPRIPHQELSQFAQQIVETEQEMALKDVMTAIPLLGMGAPRPVLLRPDITVILVFLMFALLFVAIQRSLEQKLVMTETQQTQMDVLRLAQQ